MRFFPKTLIELLAWLIMIIAWLAGIVIAKGGIAILAALIPPVAWYHVVEKVMIFYGIA